jgi:hypothetical protein
VAWAAPTTVSGRSTISSGTWATGYGFDRDGEYSAWLVQRNLYTGLARWAAATELHGEISALWTTGQFAEHKATLLDPQLLRRSVQGRPVDELLDVTVEGPVLD